ncbi:uncharacterized protein LOC127454043 isoform X2 [Myxocyprinus asiaticus]|nr:uncharacterized protein LOC127454043 isoform X2 [Myxocyprinus asiaticus]
MSHPEEYEQFMLRDALFTCYVCDRHFTCSTELMAHQRTHINKGRFKCPICDEVFRKKYELTSHKEIHGDTLGYACSECGKHFKTFTLLGNHQRTHKERPYVCLYKHCGKRFAVQRCLQQHLKRHKKDDTHGTITEKTRNKGANERRFPCPQCNKVFTTAKTQLLHLKNKHSQDKTMEALSSTASQPGPIINQTANGQPQTLCMKSVGPVPQQTDMLDPEKIKRLIEKLGNVQRVNQLVIYSLQTQSSGQPHLQALMQPLHLNFTQSTVQPPACEKTGKDQSNVEQSQHQKPSEVGNMQQKETEVLTQEEIISSGKSVTQEAPVELTKAQTQIHEVHLELIPVQTETAVLLDQAPLQFEVSENDSVYEQAQFQHIPVTQEIEALETKNRSPLMPLTETTKSQKEENVSLAVDRIVSDTVNMTESLCSGQMQDSADLSVESDTQVLSGQGNKVILSEAHKLEQKQSKKKQVESEKELSIVEQQPHSDHHSINNLQNNTKDVQPAMVEPQSQSDQHSLNNLQNDTKDVQPSMVEVQSQSDPHSINHLQIDTKDVQPSTVEPQSQSDQHSLNNLQNNTAKGVKQGSVLPPDHTQASLQDGPFLQKNLPTKKKTSNIQSVDNIETKEANKACGGQEASTKKINTSSKVITKKREKANNKKLVVRFEARENKKSSKQKVLTTSKTKQTQNQPNIDREQVVIVSQHDSKLYFKQKLQKDKGKGDESALDVAMNSVGVADKSTCQINKAKHNVVVAPEITQQGKAQKRKMKNQNNLMIKKANTVQEVQQDKTLVPVQKKKKKGKPSEKNLKKSKVRKAQNYDFQKNTHKIPKHKVTKSKCRPNSPDQAQIEQQALLLLKGHKQPQLKVHKLDAAKLEKSPQSKKDERLMQNQENVHDQKAMTQSKSSNVAHRKKTKSKENKFLESQGESLCLKMSSVDRGFTSVTSVTNPNIVRKRKAPTKIDQEIALSPPYSRLTLGCQDCGKTFSEVSALQEHMASWHSAKKVAIQDETDHVPKKRVTRPGQPNVFEIQVATDWDMEMGEILGDREEHRLSFPALSPSPSLTLASGCVEGKEQGDNVEGTVPGLEQTPDKNHIEVCQTPSQVSTPALVKCILPQEVTEDIKAGDRVLVKEPITEISCSELIDAEEGEIKEELPLDVNVVMVGDRNEEEENHSPQINNLASVSQEHENEVSNCHQCSQPQLSVKDADVVVLTQNVVHCVAEPEIKQEEEEILLHRIGDQKRVIGRNTVTRAKKGVGRGRGKRTVGRRTSTENRSKNDTEAKRDSQECQVVYQLCVLNDTPEGQDKDTDKNRANAPETVPSFSEETPEDQVVFELDSVTTSVIEVVNSEDGSFIEKSRELVRDGSSPGVILEKFLTACERNVENPNTPNQMRQANSELDVSKVTMKYTSADVKIEERSSNQAPLSLISSETGSLRGVQMFLVKAEDHLTLNDLVMFHTPTDAPRVECQDKAIDKNRDGISSDSDVVPLQSNSKQCIFYPVKEEEREHFMELPDTDQKCLDSEGLAGASSGIDECEEIRVGLVQMDAQHLYRNTEEGDVSSEQQSTQGFLEFLSQNTDTDDSDNVHTETEAETMVMSCYYGIRSNGAAHQIGMERCGPNGRKNVGPSQTVHAEIERQLSWKPINYFCQYFSWDTWKDMAVCTGEISKWPNPVTEKEVAQYVGIHIAMGTLKFPSTKLYWDDCTRVPLIADAMSASRFCEVTRQLRLASSGGASMETSSDQQSEERNKDKPQPSNKSQSHASMSRDTSRVCVPPQSHNNEEKRNCTNIEGSKIDPLWKVMPLIQRVQEGCRALKRNGCFGIDQYPLPFQRHPNHSLLYTVVISGGGLVVDFNLSVDDSNRENVVEKMVSRGKDRNDGMVFLCKPELSTPSMLEHLLDAGVQSAGKVGGARGQIGDEFVSSNGKLKLFRCHHGFILSAVVKERPRSTSLVSGFERAIKAANLNRDLRSLYRSPCTNSAASAWPHSVLWDLMDLVLVNAWLQYKQDYSHNTDQLSLMAFRLEVAKALILSSGIDAQDSSPPCPPASKPHGPDTNFRPSQFLETPLPDAVTRYDGSGHWPEQLAEGEEGKCRFGGCERTSRVQCLKCCVFLCISRNHNCFLKFHSQGPS